ncbi:hypothetical protein GWK08_03765 [Leptobacterium flavescens]|uniref:Uncharacterized protein n=1 Tax=Leptobacterium flavescens TaxID=472055 RepID=A0A6P0UH11_9FLAO|nr:nuclear transport factor 2 family protein [Leptobacterium flavescens]NER12545.1 hypothetical protein [Leptobacterium flavescens]
MKRLCYLMFFLILICVGCLEKELSTEEKERIKAEIHSMFDDYHKAISKGGLTAEFDYLDDSEDFYWVPPAYRSALSYDSVATILRSNAPSYSSVNFHWEKLEIYPLSSVLASFTGIVGGEMISTDDEVFPVSLIESGMLIKRKDGWKLLSGQTAVLEPEASGEKENTVE